MNYYAIVSKGGEDYGLMVSSEDGDVVWGKRNENLHRFDDFENFLSWGISWINSAKQKGETNALEGIAKESNSTFRELTKGEAEEYFNQHQ